MFNDFHHGSRVESVQAFIAIGQRTLEKLDSLALRGRHFLQIAKKWPSTLNGIEQIVNLDPEIDRIVTEYYQNRFIKMEPILECDNSYVYRLFTKDINSTCKVTINPDGGYCWSDSG